MAALTIDAEKVQMRIVVTFDVLTGEFGLEGCDKNPVVALGMLDFALSRVRRVLTTNDVLQEMKNAPRIAVANRLVE
jgi:hypothetical protein